MPIDIRAVRLEAGGDLERVREAQQKRGKPAGLVDEVLDLDHRWRELATEVQGLRAEIGRVQREEIAPRKRRQEACGEAVAKAEELRAALAGQEAELGTCAAARDEAIGRLGNFVDSRVPWSADEDDNLVVRLWPAPDVVELPCSVGQLQYEPPVRKSLTHEELLWRIGGYEPERGQRVAGPRGYYLTDAGVLLNQALLNFGLAFLRERGYSAVQPPYFMKRELMADVAQLADFDEQLYKVSERTGAASEERGDKYLIATSEQPLCAFHYNEVLDGRDLPLRYAGISTCFRREVGSMGKDIRGIFRVHQFEKVEQFCITAAEDDESDKMHEEMLRHAEDFHRALGLAYRVVSVVSTELNDAATIKYDLEGWFPGQGAYRELVSCSNCTDYQARALGVRYRPHGRPEAERARPAHVHMLNSTLTAAGRGLCCVLETYQECDGVRVPEALRPYAGGVAFLPFVRPSREAPRGSAATAPSTGRSAPAQPGPARGASPLWSAESLAALNGQLAHFPYLGGYSPSRQDATTWIAVQEAPLEADVAAALPALPALRRWLEHVASFSPSERRGWT